MAFEVYSGITGGVPAMMDKLQEIYKFKNIVCLDENSPETSQYQLWVSDEVYILYGKDAGWCDFKTNNLTKPIIDMNDGAIDKPWKIIKSPNGIVLGVNSLINIFISNTETADGIGSTGLIGFKDTNYYVFFDGMIAETTMPNSYERNQFMTQLVQSVISNYGIYFPNVFRVLYTDTDRYGLCKIDNLDFYACKTYMLKL